MRAVLFQDVESLTVEQITDPSIQAPTDVIVKVQSCAICGSDLHPYHGREKGLDAGTVMGHEFMGEVVAAGKDVKRLRVGDTVVSPFTTNCGNCASCLAGLTCRCQQGQLFGWRQNNAGLHGGQAEYARVPLADTTLVKVPNDLDPIEALLLGDVLSTGYFCADQAGCQKGGTYAVIGCGPVGLMAVIGARELGAERVFAIDAVPARLTIAERWGAIPLNYQTTDVSDYLLQATHGLGVDAVLEAVGSPQATRSAYELVRVGGTISAVGVHTEASIGISPTEAYDKNLTYRVGRCPARAYMERLIPLVRAKKYDLASVFSHQLPLASAVDAYDMFANRRDGCTKVLLRPDFD